MNIKQYSFFLLFFAHMPERAADVALIGLHESLRILSTVKVEKTAHEESAEETKKEENKKEQERQAKRSRALLEGQISGAILNAFQELDKDIDPAAAPESELLWRKGILGGFASVLGLKATQVVGKINAGKNNDFADFPPATRAELRELSQKIDMIWQKIQEEKENRQKRREVRNQLITQAIDQASKELDKKIELSTTPVLESVWRQELWKEDVWKILANLAQWKASEGGVKFDEAKKNDFADFPDTGDEWIKLSKKMDATWQEIQEARKPEPKVSVEPKTEKPEKTEAAAAFEMPEKLFESFNLDAAKIVTAELTGLSKQLYDLAFEEFWDMLVNKKLKVSEKSSDRYQPVEVKNFRDPEAFMRAIYRNIKKAQDALGDSDATKAIDSIVAALFYREYAYPGSWDRLLLMPTERFSKAERDLWDSLATSFVEKAEQLGWKLRFKLSPKVAKRELDKGLVFLYPSQFSVQMEALFEFGTMQLYTAFAKASTKTFARPPSPLNIKKQKWEDLGSELWLIHNQSSVDALNTAMDVVGALFVLEDMKPGAWKNGIPVDNGSLAKAEPDYKNKWQKFMEIFVEKAQELGLIE